MLSAFLGARPHQRAYPNHACVRPPGHQRKQGREREITRDEPRVSSSIVGTSRDPRFARLRAVLDPAHLLGPLSLSTPGSVLMSVEGISEKVESGPTRRRSNGLALKIIRQLSSHGCFPR